MERLLSWAVALVTVVWLLMFRRHRAVALRPPVPMVAVWSLAPILGVPLDCYFGGVGTILAAWILLTPTFYSPFRTLYFPTRVRLGLAAAFLCLGCLAAAIARLVV